MTGIAIRPATPGDVPHVLRLVRGLAEYERKLDGFTAGEADFHRLLFGTPVRAHALLAAPQGQGQSQGEAPVGVAVYFYTISTFTGRAGVFLEDLFVEPEYRGRRIGLALLQALARHAVAEEATQIEWRVLDWNQPAIDFYTELGATPMRGWHVRQLRGAALTALAQGASNNG